MHLDTSSFSFVSRLLLPPYLITLLLFLHSHCLIYLSSFPTPQRALSAASTGIEDGESFASSAREFERIRKSYELQFGEFDIIKKSLMKDLQNRCEKVRTNFSRSEPPGLTVAKQVVELEMQLDEVREQYKVIARSANSRSQQRKLEFLEHNLDALNDVQKQVSSYYPVSTIDKLTLLLAGRAEYGAQKGDCYC